MRRVRFLPLVVLIACGEDPTEPRGLVPVATVDVVADSAELVLTDTMRFRLVARAADGTTLGGRPAEWTSSDPAIVSVTNVGLATAHAVGTVTLTATIEGVPDSVRVRAHALSFTALATGGATCGITAAAELWCWGSNFYGQVGNGDSGFAADVSVPRRVPGGLAWRQVAPGGSATCALTTQDEAWCWGSNLFGQLGDGTTTDALTPVRVVGAQGFADIARPGLHTCARTAAGAVWCWGRNDEAELGDGTRTDRPAPAPIQGSWNFAAITGGEAVHTCGLDPGGAAWCWGSNRLNQLGYDTLYASYSPIPVQGGLAFTALEADTYRGCGLTAAGEASCWGQKYFNHGGKQSLTPVLEGPPNLVALSEGYEHACGLTATGAAWCWGNNSSGELGDGTITNLNTEQPPGPVTGGHAFTQIRAGDLATCALTAGGQAYCWGYVQSLGTGGTASSGTPVPVSGGLSFAALAEGDPGCGITAAGAAHCWGFRPGDGVSQYAPTPVPVAGGIVWTMLSRADGHTCGLATDDTAWCWGANSVGQLGDGTTFDRPGPVAVAGGLTFQTIMAADGHSCGVTTGGATYCWGRNNRGQLGDGSSTDRHVPTLVPGAPSFLRLAGGSAHTCGITAAGATSCWGDGYFGQLGMGMAPDSPLPLPVSGGHVFTGISAGGFTTCGIEAGVTYCWGGPYYPLTPSAVPGGTIFATLTVGDDHGCGLTSGGQAYCWGDNTSGELGSLPAGSTRRSSTPLAVTGAHQFQSLSAGAGRTCGLTTQGVAWCWGEGTGPGGTASATPVPVPGQAVAAPAVGELR